MKFVKLRKRKLQFFLLSLIFTIAVSLITICTIFTVETNIFVQKYYEGDKTPDLFFSTMSEKACDNVKDWAIENDSRNIYESKVYPLSSFTINNKKVSIDAGYILPIDNVNNITWKIDKKDNAASPAIGEVWIPNTIAETKSVNVGDIISIPQGDNSIKKLKVSEIVNDSNQPSTSLGIVYFYCNDKENFKEVPQGKYLAFNTKEKSSEAYKSVFNKLNGALAGFIIDKETCINCAIMPPMIAGTAALVAVIILFIVLIIIVKSNLWSHILEEYRNIGLYKSIGMTTKQICKIYVKDYMAVSAISSVFGVIISIPASVYICNQVFKYLGEYKIDTVSVIIIISIFVSFNLLIYISLISTLRKIKNIKPVEAINIGITSTKEKLKKPLIAHTINPFLQSVNDIFKNKKKNLIILTMFIVVFYMSTLFTGIYVTIKDMNNHFDSVFGIPQNDLLITTNSDKENSAGDIIKYIKNKDYISSYYVYNEYAAQHNFYRKDFDYKADVVAFLPMVFDKFNESDFCIKEGRNPRNKDEVALSQTVMKNNNFKIGDYIKLNIKGEKKSFLITGMYASMMNNSQNFRITNEGIKSEGGNMIYIKLKNKNDYSKIKKDIEEKFSYAIVSKNNSVMEDAMVQIQDIIMPVMIILVVGMVLFALINVVNTIVSVNRENRKKYGIMKAVGFTSKDIIKRSVYRIMILSLTGALIGGIICDVTIGKLMELIMSGINCVTFTAADNITLCVVILLIIFITSMVCSRSVNKISTVELMEE